MDCWRGSSDEDVLNGSSRPDPCLVHHQQATAIWATFATIWTIACLACGNALRTVRRHKSKQQYVEPKILSILFSASFLFGILGFFKASNPSETAIGVNLVSTLFFAMGNALFFIFVAFTPLNPSGTGITSFAIKRRRNIHLAYTRAFPVLLVFTTTASFLPFLGMTSLKLLDVAVTVLFAVYAFVVAVVCVVDVYCVQKLRRDFKKALTQKRNQVTESQKRGIELIMESTGKSDLAMAVCTLTIVPSCLLIAAGLESAREACWVLIPAMLVLGSGWVIRYALFSRQISQRVASRRNSSVRYSEIPTSTRKDRSTNDHRQQQGQGGGRKLTLTNHQSPRPLTRVDEVDNEGTIVSKVEPELIGGGGMMINKASVDTGKKE